MAKNYTHQCIINDKIGYKPYEYMGDYIPLSSLNKKGLTRLYDFIKGGFVGIPPSQPKKAGEDVITKDVNFVRAFLHITNYDFLRLTYSHSSLSLDREDFFIIPKIFYKRTVLNYLFRLLPVICENINVTHFLDFQVEKSVWLNSKGKTVDLSTLEVSNALKAFLNFSEELIIKHSSLSVEAGNIYIKAHPPMDMLQENGCYSALSEEQYSLWNEYFAYTFKEYLNYKV